MKDAAAAFADQHLSLDRVLRMDKASMFEPSLVPQLHAAGLMGIEIPVEHGGSGASFLAACLAVEELAKRDASVSVMVDVQNTLVNNVFKMYASPELQAFAWPRLATRSVASFALSEPGSGSDAFALTTRAERTGDYYTITGSKCWITNGGEAELFLIFANVDPSKGYKGITCFLAERDTPGLTVGKREDKLGIKASSTVVLNFDGLKVPASRVVGKVGEGYKYAIGILNEGRVGIAAQMLGIAQGAFDLGYSYAMQRKQFGGVVGEFQGMQHQFAQVATEIEAARALTYNAARLKMRLDEETAKGAKVDHTPFVKQAAMAKLLSSQVAEKSASKAIEWMGGMGFVRESGVEKYYRDAKIGAIYEGTSNIQLNTSACRPSSRPPPPPPPFFLRAPMCIPCFQHAPFFLTRMLHTLHVNHFSPSFPPSRQAACARVQEVKQRKG